MVLLSISIALLALQIVLLLINWKKRKLEKEKRAEPWRKLKQLFKEGKGISFPTLEDQLKDLPQRGKQEVEGEIEIPKGHIEPENGWPRPDPDRICVVFIGGPLDGSEKFLPLSWEDHLEGGVFCTDGSQYSLNETKDGKRYYVLDGLEI